MILILSDEVHCDLTHRAVSIRLCIVSEAISNISMTCMAPSKAFNIPGLQTSRFLCQISPPQKVNRVSIQTSSRANSFAIQATEKAFNDSKVGWNESLFSN